MGTPIPGAYNDKLESFAEMARQSTAAVGGGTDLTRPPYRIPSRVLDANYVAASPGKWDGNNPPYVVEFSPNGWRLKPVARFTICENGAPVDWLLFGHRAPAA